MVKSNHEVWMKKKKKYYLMNEAAKIYVLSFCVINEEEHLAENKYYLLSKVEQCSNLNLLILILGKHLRSKRKTIKEPKS